MFHRVDEDEIEDDIGSQTDQSDFKRCPCILEGIEGKGKDPRSSDCPETHGIK